jgi:hypothetical protein
MSQYLVSTHRALAVLTLLSTFGFAGPTFAADGGFYLGGGVGASTVTDELPTGDVEEEDTAWKAFAGYRIGGFIPLLDFAGEVTYRDFGKPEGSNLQYEASGYDASALLIVTLGPIDLIGRYGLGSYEVDKTIAGVPSGDDGSGAIYGLGAGFRIWRVNLRAEWERIDADGVDNLDMYTLNAYFRF